MRSARTSALAGPAVVAGLLLGGCTSSGGGTSFQASTVPTPASSASPTSATQTNPPASGGSESESSSGAATKTDLGAVVGNGRTYSLPNTADVPATKVPNPCALLPAASATAALGATAQVLKTGTQSCNYRSTSADGSMLSVQYGDLGSSAASQYAKFAGGSAKAKVMPVSGVGRKAQSSVDEFNAAQARTDVLAKQVWFWVEFDPGTNQHATEKAARRVATTVAKAIAAEFPS